MCLQRWNLVEITIVMPSSQREILFLSRSAWLIIQVQRAGETPAESIGAREHGIIGPGACNLIRRLWLRQKHTIPGTHPAHCATYTRRWIKHSPYHTVKLPLFMLKETMKLIYSLVAAEETRWRESARAYTISFYILAMSSIYPCAPLWRENLWDFLPPRHKEAGPGARYCVF